MPASSPITRQTVGKTFIVASTLLGLGAIAQVTAITWAFATRFQQTVAAIRQGAERALQPRVVTDARASATFGSEPDEALKLADPSVDVELPPVPVTPPSASTARTPIPPPPKPIPVAPEKPGGRVPQTRFEELVQQGRTLRERGDTSSALVRLREAQTVDPKNPLAIAEIAMTYEKMGLHEKAAEQWRRIYEMGENAGSFYIAADARLKQSQALAMMQAQSAAPPAGDVTVSSTKAAATLGIGIISIDELTDAESERKFILRVPLKARPRAHVEVRDVVIQVLFYDFVDNKDIVETSANVNSRWASTPPDWSDGDTEVLEVEYEQPKSDVTTAPRENRKYFGYIVRLYYKEDLQDSRADPARLGAQFPAPTTLPKETSQ